MSSTRIELEEGQKPSLKTSNQSSQSSTPNTALPTENVQLRYQLDSMNRPKYLHFQYGQPYSSYSLGNTGFIHAPNKKW